jgi:hypothetical protein
MFYKYDKESLIWKRDWKKMKISFGVVSILFISSFVLGRYVKFESLDKYEQELLILDLQNEQNKFSQEKLVDELKRLNVKYPHIVMAQSIIETGHWKSKVFKENHNLFGMKQAIIRINTAKGTQNNHAYYDSWQESLYDYAFYQCRYMSNINSEENYFLALGASYAEAPDYINALKNVIKRENLKDLF